MMTVVRIGGEHSPPVRVVIRLVTPDNDGHILHWDFVGNATTTDRTVRWTYPGPVTMGLNNVPLPRCIRDCGIAIGLFQAYARRRRVSQFRERGVLGEFLPIVGPMVRVPEERIQRCLH